MNPARADAIRRLNDGTYSARLALMALGVDPDEISTPQPHVPQTIEGRDGSTILPR